MKKPQSHNRIGQSRSLTVIEYMFLIVVLVAALVGMSIYFKRALSGKWKEAMDANFGHGRQYEPGVTTTQVRVGR